jgi:hypothetical protein
LSCLKRASPSLRSDDVFNRRCVRSMY